MKGGQEYGVPYQRAGQSTLKVSGQQQLGFFSNKSAPYLERDPTDPGAPQ